MSRPHLVHESLLGQLSEVLLIMWKYWGKKLYNLYRDDFLKIVLTLSPWNKQINKEWYWNSVLATNQMCSALGLIFWWHLFKVFKEYDLI